MFGDVTAYCKSFPTLYVLIKVLHVSSEQQQTVQHTLTEAGTAPAGPLHLCFGIHPHPYSSWTAPTNVMNTL